MRRIRTEQARLGLLLALSSSLGGGVLPARVAWAEDGAARAEARLHFTRAVALAKQRAYAEALLEFQRAYASAPHFSVLYNIGQAQVALGQAAASVATLQRYLEEGGPNIDANRRSEVESTIERERARANTQTPPTADEPMPELVDLTPLTVAPAPPVAAAAPSAPAPPAEPVTTAAPVRANRVVAPELPPARTDSPRPSPSAPRPAASAEKPRSKRTLAYVVGVAGVGLSGVTVAHYLWNRARYQDWQSRYAAYPGEPTAGNRQSINALSTSITRASAVTVALAIGAGLALGTSMVLLVTSSAPDSDLRARGRSPFVSVEGTF